MKYTPEDETLLNDLYNKLLKSCEKIAKSDEDWEIIKKAFFFAKDAHKGVKRRSGEPYFIHPIAVAMIVVDEIGLGIKSVAAALLHDVVEDTEYTVEDIEMLFGAKVASMVDGLTKMSIISNTETSAQAENFRKMLLTLSDDIRVIVIKIADRLHNMRTLGSIPVNKQIKIASETVFLFAPLAYRLGFYAIKSELEDISLRYRFPEQYEEIVQKLDNTDKKRSEFIDKFNAPLIKSLKESGFEFEIAGRVKSVHSIWSKMQRQQIPFEEIYDLFAIKIIFHTLPLIPEKTQCWHIYSLITDIYKPKTARIRDWVSTPKANGYEALHATVMGPDGIWVEVQIRSERMEEVAERGFAAHWKYKQPDTLDDGGEFDKWLKDVKKALSNQSGNAVDFLDKFKMTLYTTEVVVFTPKGESRTLPMGATALDFAYDIHSKVAMKAIGAKINHKIESIYTPITTGDQIEIITSENVNPKAEWLDHVITVKARQSIMNYLRRDKESNIRLGIEVFDNKLKEFGITPSARVFRKILPAYECKTKDEFYSKLGLGIISLDGIEKILRQNSASKMLNFWTIQIGNPLKIFSSTDEESGEQKEHNFISGDEPEFTISECCNPIPGDAVIGYKNPSTNKIDVHKTLCDELTRLATQHGERVTSVKWSSHKAMSYLSVIAVRGLDRVGILMELLQVITGELGINIRELHVMSHDGIFEGNVSVYVQNIDDLNTVIEKVSKIKGVDKANRMTTLKG